MADDLVAQLRRDAAHRGSLGFDYEARRYTEAADEIERLRALGDGLYFALNHLRHGCNPDCEADHAYPQADDALAVYEEGTP